MCIDEVHVSTVQGMHTCNYIVSTLLAVVNETVDHIPSSCIVMVHVIRGCQYRVCTVYINAGASIAEMESETGS